MNFASLLSVIFVLLSITAEAGNTGVHQVDSISKQATIQFSPNQIAILPTIGKLKDRVGLRVGLLFWSTEIFTGDVEYLDKDIYLIVRGTPDHFYFNLVNLQCSKEHLIGAQVVSRLFSAGELRYSTEDGMYSSREVTSRFLVGPRSSFSSGSGIVSGSVDHILVTGNSWIFHRIGGRSYREIAELMHARLQKLGKSSENESDDFNYLCTSEFRALMSEYNMSNIHLQKAEPFQLAFKSGDKPKITISWKENWIDSIVDPIAIETKSIVLKAEELLQTVLTPPSEFAQKAVYQNIVEMRKDVIQSIRNMELGLREKRWLAETKRDKNSPRMIDYANSIEDFVGSMSFIRVAASPLSGAYGAEIVEKLMDILANSRDAIMKPEEEKVRSMQLEDFKNDLEEKNQRLEKYLKVYLALQENVLDAGTRN